MTAPMISVITPVYNMEEFVGPAIQSVLDQTYGDFELLLIDDCSTDKSLEVMETYAARDDRVKIFSTPMNSWAHAAGNVGLEHASGKYIAILDADDILALDRFEKQIALLEENSNMDVCGGWMTLFGDSNKTMKTFQRDDQKIRMGLLFDSTMGHGTAMIRHRIIQDHRIRYDTDIFYAHDYHFFTQLAFDGHATFTSLPEVVYFYRWHAAQTSTAKRKEQIGFSDEVRKSVLSRFGITHPAITETHLHFCHKQPQKITDPGRAVVRYFEAMVEANIRLEIFPNAAFKTYLASKLCYGMHRCGLRGLKFYMDFPYKENVAWSVHEAFLFFAKSLRLIPKA
jgi:glycosyltransferase involved in cell wall biosynthesis